MYNTSQNWFGNAALLLDTMPNACYIIMLAQVNNHDFFDLLYQNVYTAAQGLLLPDYRSKRRAGRKVVIVKARNTFSVDSTHLLKKLVSHSSSRKRFVSRIFFRAEEPYRASFDEGACTALYYYTNPAFEVVRLAFSYTELRGAKRQLAERVASRILKPRNQSLLRFHLEKSLEND